MHCNQMVEKNNYKIVTLGNPNVGKSSIIQRYISDEFVDCSESTVGARYVLKSVEYKGKTINLNIWDTAGQERYQAFSKMYCRDAKAVILVCDLTDLNSFYGMKQWYDYMKTDALPEDAFIFIAGNKSDIASDETMVKNEIEKYSAVLQAETFYVSAKTGDGMQELFKKVIEKLSNKHFPLKRSIVIKKRSDLKKNKRKICQC